MLFRSGLDREALTPFGAAGSDHRTTAACFHTRQEAVCASAFDFGGLIGAFHDESKWPMNGRVA